MIISLLFRALLVGCVVVAGGRDPSRQEGTVRARPHAVVYATGIHTEISPGTAVALPQGNAGGTAEFNSALLAGVRGLPGMKLRMNYPAFQYASRVMRGAIDSEIKRARIPPILQCLPQVNGCIHIYNIYVARYRCAQMVTISPLPPNRISLSVQNFDIGIAANLGGQITLLLPIPLSGIVHMDAHQVSITVQLVLVRSATGAPFLQMVGCTATIGYVDAYLENGGLIGEIVNNQFRAKISEQVRAMIPNRLCAMLPQAINERLNSRLASAIPSSIPFSTIASMASGLFGGGATNTTIPAYCYTPTCIAKSAAAAQASANSSHGSAPTAQALNPPPPNPPPPPNDVEAGNRHLARGVAVASDTRTAREISFSGVVIKPHPLSRVPVRRNQSSPSVPTRQGKYLPDLPSDLRRSGFRFSATQRARAQAPATDGRYVRSSIVKIRAIPLSSSAGLKPTVEQRQPLMTQSHRPMAQQQMMQPRQIVTPQFRPMSAEEQQMMMRQQQQQQFMLQQRQVPMAVVWPLPQQSSLALHTHHVRAANTVSMDEQDCIGCPGIPAKDDTLSAVQDFLKDLDLSKLSDLYLTTQIMNTYATANDFTVDLTGEFVQAPNIAAPFGPFPMSFPTPVGDRMADVLISDFVLNSLFYHIHRKGFINFRIGPETPKIGDLLKTTCSDEEANEELEDHGVEVDEEEEGGVGRTGMTTTPPTALSTTGELIRHRVRRADDDTGTSEGGLADLGICFGDIMPAVREKYPNKRLHIIVRSTRAPSVVLSGNNGGTATVDLMADADIYIEETNEKVGTISIAAIVDVVVQSSGNKLTGTAEMRDLKLADHGETLGLPQDALDNLASLGKEMLAKVANDALAKGITLEMPTSTLPITFINPQLRIVDHAILISSDFSLSPSLLAEFQGDGSCGRRRLRLHY